MTLRLEGRGESDGIVEGKAERVMGNIVALTAVEQVLLEIVTDGEQATAGLVDSAVDTVGAQSTLGARVDGSSLRR